MVHALQFDVVLSVQGQLETFHADRRLGLQRLASLQPAMGNGRAHGQRDRALGGHTHLRETLLRSIGFP
jgi:hypothetical protein